MACSADDLIAARWSIGAVATDAMGNMSTVENLLISGTGPAMAAVFTNPLDVARVNMQINGEGGGARAYRNTGDCMVLLWRKDGVLGVQRGLKTAMCREFVQNVPRLGLYTPLMQAWRRADGTLGDSTADPFSKRLCVAIFCGAFGGVFSNPLEIVKARVQSGRYSYRGPLNGLYTIATREGIASWFKGADASAVRCGVGTSSQLLAQTYAKDLILASSWYRGLEGWSPAGKLWVAYCLSGLWSGVVLSCAMQPFDTARTRLYTDAADAKSRYRKGVMGLVDAMAKTHASEGIPGLYKGLTGNILRQGPHMAVAFSFISLIKSGVYGDSAR